MNTNTFDPSTVDPKKAATYKQIRKVAITFSTPDFTIASKVDWRRVNVNVALILKYHNEVKNESLTHGEVQDMLSRSKLPRKYRDLYVDRTQPEPAEETGGVIDELEALPF